jgi:hypothetical protein
MKIKGVIDSWVPTIPERLKNKIELRATYDLTEREAKLFAYAFTKLDEQLIEDNINLDFVPYAYGVFTENCCIEMYED